MKRRGYVIIAMVTSILLFASLACGSSSTTSDIDTEEAESAAVEQSNADDEERPAQEPAEEPTDAPTATPEPTPIPQVGSADSPAPLGEAVDAQNFRFIVNEITKPADDIVANGNMFNTEPEETQEYMMVNLTATCIVDECSFFPSNFDMVGAKGVAYSEESFIAGVDGMLETTELLENGEVTGSIFFLVDKDDSNLLLRWEPLLGDKLYFITGEYAASAGNEDNELLNIEPVATSRDNPAPFGEPLAIPNYVFIVNGITVPADDIVAAGNSFNTEPEEGQTYLMVDLTVMCRTEECSFSTYNFTVVGDKSKAYDVEIFVTGVDGMLDNAELLKGASRTGSIFFIVDQDDTNLLLRWEPMVGDEAFLALE